MEEKDNVVVQPIDAEVPSSNTEDKPLEPQEGQQAVALPLTVMVRQSNTACSVLKA